MTEKNKRAGNQEQDGIPPKSSGMAVREMSIEYADIPELSEAWFQHAKRATQLPYKKQVSLRIDEDILDFFKQQGNRYQTKMHAVLRAYVDGHKSINKN